ncbi:MAG: hypothetical protein LBL23_07420 [Coriobacteriales bacterium]|jgi:hypothetical protein|nr:hypothetical protein [Coriobacteriales bacterium]
MKRRRTQQRTVLATAVAAASVVAVLWFCWPLFSPVGEEQVGDAPQLFSTAESAAEAVLSAEEDTGTPGMDGSAMLPVAPLQLDGFRQSGEYERAQTLESWRLVSDASCADYALGVLEDIHRQGFELVHAGFMDLSGESWGCVFTGSSGEAVSVMLLPERPFSPRSDANPLVVNILHYFAREGLT